MSIIFIEIHNLHLDVGPLLDVEASLATLTTQGEKIMGQLEDMDVQVKAVKADLDTTVSNIIAYVAARDAIDADLNAQIAALTAAAASDAGAKATLAADIADAFAAAETAKGQLPTPTPAP